jgi:hypothetical protein
MRLSSAKMRPSNLRNAASGSVIASFNHVAREVAAPVFLFTAALIASACGRQDQRLRQHDQKLESLAASATAIGRAWLAGSTSGTYTITALEQTYVLVEKERAALASTPDALVDPRGAELSQTAERLSRVLAAIRYEVRGADAASVRQRLHDIEGLRTER